MPYNKLGDLQELTFSAAIKPENKCIILTLDNIVTLMGNVTTSSQISAGSVIGTLPENIRPLNPIVLPVVCYYTSFILRYLIINADGTMQISGNINGTIYLNGLTFNINDKYYNAEIGNNYPQGTSPL